MDLIFLTVVAIISDLLLASFGLIGIRLFLSIAYPMVVISYIRWHKYGLFTNFIVIIAHLLIYGIIGKVEWPIAALHALSIIGFSSVLIIIALTNQQKQKVSSYIYLMMYTLGFLTVFLLEWGLYNLFGFKLNLISHGFNHILNFLFGLFIIFITSKQKDLLINMRYYLIHKDKEV
jgi:hypothetical protein